MKDTVLITGSTSGIGLELSKLFARGGYNLVIVARSEKDLITTALLLENEYSCKVTTISKDLFGPESGFELHEEVKSKGIIVDILVNDAGHMICGKALVIAVEAESEWTGARGVRVPMEEIDEEALEIVLQNRHVRSGEHVEGLLAERAAK